MHVDERVKSVISNHVDSRAWHRMIAWENNFVTICRMKKKKVNYERKIYSATREPAACKIHELFKKLILE